MSSKPQLSLGIAGWVAAAMYVAALVVLPLVGTFVKAPHPAPAASLRVLVPVFAAIAVGDYLVSLFLEHSLLSSIAKRGTVFASTAVGSGNVVVVVAALGASIALYGFILSMLGSARWPLFFYVLCFIHGVHLLARAQSFPRPAGS